MPIFRKIKHPTPWLIGILATGLLATATAAYFTIRNTTSKPDIADLTVPAIAKDLTVQIKANGVVQAVRKINLSPKEAGRIVQLYVDEGDRASIRAAAFQMTNILTRLHGKKDFTIVASKSFQDLVGQVTGAMSLMLAAIASISLFIVSPSALKKLGCAKRLVPLSKISCYSS
jgi:hypothetical protein